MTTMTGHSKLQEALDEILTGDWRDARTTAIAALSGGFAMTSVVCERCAPESPMTFVGAVRHLMKVESDRVAEHPELEHSPLHQVGDLRPGKQNELAPEPWAAAPCKYCRAPIIWAVTSRDNRVPVDQAPDPNGSVLLVAMDSDGLKPPFAQFLRSESERLIVDRDRLHTLHINTCTNPRTAK